MKKFKQLIVDIVEATGAASKAAAIRFTRSLKPAPIKSNTTVVKDVPMSGGGKTLEVFPEDPSMPGSGKAYDLQTYQDRQVALSAGKDRRERVKSELQTQAAQRGKEKAKSTAALTKQIAKSETSAKTFGIPDIHAIVKGQQGPKDVAGVTVVGHEKNGYIALHQGVLHFKHPNGKTHAGIELQPSHQGIAVWAMSKGKRSNKPIAHIHPKGDAIPVSGYVRSGNVQIDAEDELNK